MVRRSSRGLSSAEDRRRVGRRRRTLALLGSVVLGQFWYHSRPFVGHPHQTLLLVHHAADNSFPSDHASVAFAIAFAVMAVYRRLGLSLLIAAAAIATDRIFVGVHYPVDVATSLMVGLASALLVTIAGRAVIRWTVEQSEQALRPARRGGSQHCQPSRLKVGRGVIVRHDGYHRAKPEQDLTTRRSSCFVNEDAM